MKTSLAFALLFVTFVLISMIDFSREEEMEESGIRSSRFSEQERDCVNENHNCMGNIDGCCAELHCYCSQVLGTAPDCRCLP
nr:venom protein [Lampona murina]